MNHCVSQRKEPIDFILVMGITVITDTNQLKENVQHYFFSYGEKTELRITGKNISS